MHTNTFCIHNSIMRGHHYAIARVPIFIDDNGDVQVYTEKMELTFDSPPTFNIETKVENMIGSETSEPNVYIKKCDVQNVLNEPSHTLRNSIRRKISSALTRRNDF